MASASPDELFQNFDDSESRVISNWKLKRATLIRQRVREEVEAELETDPTMVRRSTPFIRLKVISINCVASNREEAVMTIWDPTEAQLNLLKEGQSFVVQNLAVGDAMKDGYLQLTANTRTAFEATCSNTPSIGGVQYSRHCLSLFQVHALSRQLSRVDEGETSGRLPDIDIAGVLFKQSADSKSTDGFNLYLTDESELLLRVQCDRLPSGIGKQSKLIRKGIIATALPLALGLCDLQLLPYDEVEDCAVARYGIMSRTSKTLDRIQILEHWMVSCSKQLRLIQLYFDMKLTQRQQDQVEHSSAFGYVVSLKTVGNEKLHVQVDCGDSRLEEWELPFTILQETLPSSRQSPPSSLLRDEERRASELGVLRSIILARGLIWSFRLKLKQGPSVESSSLFVVTHMSPADKRSLGELLHYAALYRFHGRKYMRKPIA